MKYVKMFTILIAAAMLMLVAGCGSSKDSAGTVSGDADDVIASAETQGVLNCVKCHSAATPETLTWLSSTHGNSNGTMRYDDDPHGEGSSCTPCHNQLLDGDKMAQAFPPNLQIGTDDGTPTGNPIFANVSRDIVTCESCHGGGQFHAGVGPIPYPRPDWEQCVACHDHEGKRHEDDFGNLASNIGASAHNNSDDLHASSAKCQRCHTAEGSVAFAQYTGDRNLMAEMDAANDDVQPFDVEENLHPVTCAACHIPHDDSLRADSFIVNDNALATGDWDPNGSGTPDQFDFCTSCHTYYNQDGTLIGSGSVASGTAPHYHNTAWYRVIPTTHYDNPATGYGLASNIAEGYVIREDSASPCFDCHGHELRTNTRRSRDTADPGEETPQDYGYTIHTQWASSGHAGNLLDQKYAAADGQASRTEAQVDAVMAAGVDSTSGDAWIHYDWDATTEWDGVAVVGDRDECQMCHTATGAMNYLNDPTAYDPLNNDFSHLDGWSLTGGTNGETVSSAQNELLYCWGCHENAGTGVLRNPGAITRPYTVGAVAVVLPDIGKSNVCANCHGARGNMEGYFPDVVENPTTDFTALNAGFGPGTKNVTEAHYLVASATLYAADTRIGYEYSVPGGALLDYVPVSFFAHDSIMLNADVPESGSGPCVGCHMKTEGSHFFEVVEKDGTGVITALNSTTCVTCHDGGQGPALVTEDGPLGTAAAAAAFLEEEAEGYHEALEILRVGLSALGIEFQSNYPYFNTTVAGSWINEGNFGAAHNYNYLHHEPGAYAHNRYYAKRLLFDSIDWVDNYTLDGSITVDAVTYPEAALWLGADAVTGVATRP